MDAAHRIAALTHGDRAAWKGSAIFHELIRLTFEDTDPLAALPDILALVHPGHRGRYATVLAPQWHPDQATEFNGAVWPCLGSAVWALRTTTSFEDAIHAAIDLGGDTDTVAAVTGGLAGAYYGLHAFPARWTQPLHVPLPGFDGRVLHPARPSANRVRVRTRPPARPWQAGALQTPRRGPCAELLAYVRVAAQPDTGCSGSRVVRSDVAVAHRPQRISPNPAVPPGSAERSEPVPGIRRRRAPARGPAF